MISNFKFKYQIFRKFKARFKRTISWNKIRTEITTQTKNNNLDYLIYPTLRNTTRLFVLSFKSSNDATSRNSFDKYYIPLVEIKSFNSLIYNKPFFDQSVKNKEEAMTKLSKCQERMTIH